jgi:hypothetical protein
VLVDAGDDVIENLLLPLGKLTHDCL